MRLLLIDIFLENSVHQTVSVSTSVLNVHQSNVLSFISTLNQMTYRSRTIHHIQSISHLYNYQLKLLHYIRIRSNVRKNVSKKKI